MNKKNLHDIFETNINSLMSSDDTHTPSMRHLSTSIGASESYMQKILNTNSFPSIEKLQQIAQHYGVDPWMLLYDYNQKDMLSVIQLLEQCPPELFPTISKYIEFLLEQNGK